MFVLPTEMATHIHFSTPDQVPFASLSASDAQPCPPGDPVLHNPDDNKVAEASKMNSLMEVL